MRVTGAFLADSASAVDGKLDVRGGFLRGYLVGIERVVAAHLIVIAQFEADDGADGATPMLTIDLITPSGDSQQLQVNMPWAVPGETGFAAWPLKLPAEEDGTYRLDVRGDADGDSGGVSVVLSVSEAG